MNARWFGRYRPGGLETPALSAFSRLPLARWVHQGSGVTPGYITPAGLSWGFGPLPAVARSVNVGNRGSCISAATETSPAQLPGAKAMMPAMAAPALLLITPLIAAGRMIPGSRHSPE